MFFFNVFPDSTHTCPNRIQFVFLRFESYVPCKGYYTVCSIGVLTLYQYVGVMSQYPTTTVILWVICWDYFQAIMLVQTKHVDLYISIYILAQGIRMHPLQSIVKSNGVRKGQCFSNTKCYRAPAQQHLICRFFNTYPRFKKAFLSKTGIYYSQKQ